MKTFFLMLLLACVSCATRTPVTDKLQDKKQLSHRIKDVPVIKQDDYHCGPATLAMVMQYHGGKQRPEEMAHGLFHKKLKGSFFPEMKSRARAEGMMVLEINDLKKVFEEVRAGNPVIVLQNNGIKFFPRWHFAVLTGMDFDGPDVYLNDGNKKVNVDDMRLFERSFILGGRRALVILPAGKLGATSSEIDHVEAALMLESLGKIQEASRSYLSILERWPLSQVATIGASNTLYALGAKKEAMQILKRASDKLSSKTIWHNLASIQDELGLKKEAAKSAMKAKTTRE